jgi:cytochrome P450
MIDSRVVTLMDFGVDEVFVRDPITPLVELMRIAGPVVRGRGNKFGGLTVSDHFLLPRDRESFLVLGFDAVQRVLTDSSFSVELGYGFSMGQTMGRVLITMDDPDHARYRKLVATAFTPRQVDAEFVPRHIYPVIDRRVAALAPNGSADLVFDFAMPYPYEVIALLTGVPVDLENRMAQLTKDMLDMAIDPSGPWPHSSR